MTILTLIVPFYTAGGIENIHILKSGSIWVCHCGTTII